MAEYKDKFIAYLDICGFTKLVKASDENGLTPDEILDLLSSFGSAESRNIFNNYGPNICPSSVHVNRDLDFRVTQISDCAVISSEISPAGIINLIHHCWGTVFKLLQQGFMCRGYITRGNIYHTDNQFIGTGYLKACMAEKEVSAFKMKPDEKGTPFVEIDPIVCD